MVVGTVREIKRHEYRIGLTPQCVQAYAACGHRVLVESGAGEAAGFPDQDYTAHGVVVAAPAAEIWSAADRLVKVKEPQPSEFPFLRPGLVLFTYLHLAAERALAEALLRA